MRCPVPLSPEENNTIAKRFFQEAWNHGNFAVLEELTTPETVDHSTLHGHPEKGTESFRKIISMFRAGFPDLHLTINDEIYSGDKVVHRWTLKGTHAQEFMGIPATGKSVEFTGMTIVRMKDGKLAERWSNIDMMRLLQELGAVPAPPGA
jgi:steroid delta-isomerase-like uncharacterized protein